MGLHADHGWNGAFLRSTQVGALAGLLLGVGAPPVLGQGINDPANRIFLDRSLGVNDCPPTDTYCPVPKNDTSQVWGIEYRFGQPSPTGRNLYHSFQFFDLAAGWRAQFLDGTGTPEVYNVIARVTGGDESDIAGLIDTSNLTNANLFFLNPAGVVFTKDASLDLSRSIYTSTADLLKFGATDLPFPTGTTDVPATLADADPTAFGFLSDAPARISFSREGVAPGAFRVNDGETFAAVGGDISFRGNGLRQIEDIQANGGTIAFASIGSALDVPVNVADFQAEGRSADSLGTIVVTDQALIDAGAPAGTDASGSIVIRAGRFVMDGGRFRASNRSPADDAPQWAFDVELADAADDGVGGRLVLNGDVFWGALNLGDGRGSGVRIVAGGVEMSGTADITSRATRDGANGDIVIRTGSLEMTDQSEINSNNRSDQEGGDVRITATGDVVLEDDALILNVLGRSSGSAQAGPDATGGTVEIVAEDVMVRGDALIGSQAFSGSAGADIDIAATGDVLVADDGRIVAQVGQVSGVQPGPDTVGGAVRISGANVTVQDEGLVSSQTFAGQAGGALAVTAEGEIVDGALVDGVVSVTQQGEISSLAASNAPSTATAGTVTVTAPVIRVESEDLPAAAPRPAQISAVTEGQAAGGALEIRTTKLELLEGGQLRTTTSPPGSVTVVTATGPAGDLTVQGIDAAQPLDSVRISGTSTLGTSTQAAGMFARSSNLATGDAGDISIYSRTLDLENGAEISARSVGAGKAGRIVVAGADGVAPAERVTIAGGPEGPAIIEAQVGDEGADDGEPGLSITADRVELRDGGSASASTTGAGDAGQLVVNAQELTISGSDGFNPSGLFSQTLSGDDTSGDAGGIELNVSDRLTVADGARVSVESRGIGLPGDIQIRGTRSVVVTGGAEVSAAVVNTRPPGAGEDGRADILIENIGSLEVSDGGAINAETRGTGDGGRITIRDADRVAVIGGRISALSNGVPPGVGDAGSITIGESGRPVGSLVVTAGTISTQTADDGAGGDISVVATRRVVLQDGSRVTAESTGDSDAGNIVIDAGQEFLAVNNSVESGRGVLSTRADNASGGIIQIRASKLVYLSDSRIETQVQFGGGPEGDGGDFGTPKLFGVSETVPPAELVVLNRSRIVASSIDGFGGNIFIDGTFLPSDALVTDEDLALAGDSVLDATSQNEAAGLIVITSPSSELAGQLVPLPSNYLDASKLLLTPCAARRSRAGSFTVELEAIEAPPDAPFTGGEPLGDGLEGCESEEAIR